MPERPGELIYALDETPPRPHLLALGFQHVAVICPYLVMVALVAEAAKLPHHAAQSAVGLAIIAVAFMTVLQSLRLGSVGSGYLCPRRKSAAPSTALSNSVGVKALPRAYITLRRRSSWRPANGTSFDDGAGVGTLIHPENLAAGIVRRASSVQ